MAPLPANNTRVHFFRYFTGRVSHFFQVRSVGSASNETVFDAVQEFLDGLAPWLPEEWLLEGVSVRQAGADISLPLALPAGLAAFRGDDTSPEGEASEPKEFNFVGRTAGGRRVELSVYGVQLPFVPSYRYPATGSGVPLSAAYDALISNTGVFIGIDGLAASWYPYINVNNNSYWEARARRGL